MPRALRAGVFAFAAALVATGLPGCVSVPSEPRAIYLVEGHDIGVVHLDCAAALAQARRTAATAPGLDPAAIRVFTWNIHKEADPGWQADLDGFAQESDLVLLQELVLDPAIRRILEGAGLRWSMASSFQRHDLDIGVLTAARAPPLATCTQRVDEPLLRIPKSAVITWFALKGSTEALAVVNMHSINFALSLGAYREQLAAMREVLSHHAGPIVFAGDLNTWTTSRYRAVHEVAAELGLHEVSFAHERRKAFWGKQLDHIFVRGLDVTDSDALPVTSSDHNPVQATLRWTPPSSASTATRKGR